MSANDLDLIFIEFCYLTPLVCKGKGKVKVYFISLVLLELEAIYNFYD